MPNTRPNPSNAANTKQIQSEVKIGSEGSESTKRKADEEPPQTLPRKSSRQASVTTTRSSSSGESSAASADVRSEIEDAAPSRRNPATPRSPRAANHPVTSNEINCPPSLYVFPIQRVPTLNNPFKIWQLTHQPVSYDDVQAVIQNTIGDAPSIAILNKCRDRNARTLDPLDSKPWTVWRYGKYLHNHMQQLKERANPTVEAGMITTLEALLKVDDRYVPQLFIALFGMLRAYEKQALKEVGAAVNSPAEKNWLGFFLQD